MVLTSANIRDQSPKHLQYNTNPEKSKGGIKKSCFFSGIESRADIVKNIAERCERADAISRFGGYFDCYKGAVVIGVANAYPSKIRNGLEEFMAGNWKSLELGHEAARFLFEETQTINRLNIYKYLMFKDGLPKKIGNPCRNRLHTMKSYFIKKIRKKKYN